MLPKNVHFFTDNIFRKVSSGQICPRFLRTCLSSIIVEILTIQKADPFPFFYRTLVTPPQKKILFWKREKLLNYAGTEPNTHMFPLTPISSLLRLPLAQSCRPLTHFWSPINRRSKVSSEIRSRSRSWAYDAPFGSRYPSDRERWQVAPPSGRPRH